MNFYKFFRPLIFLLSPETAHKFAIFLLSKNMLWTTKCKEYPILASKVFAIEFKNPIGLAAGFDKNAQCIKNLTGFGFGFIEIGTVTLKPQTGNDKPRIFRLKKDRAIINRLGFNNQGIKLFLANLARATIGKTIIGANIGKNKNSENSINDYLLLLEKLYGKSQYITVNISSPNTPGLRELQKFTILDELLAQLMQKRELLIRKHGTKIPLLLKISPDEDENTKDNIAKLLLKHGVDGLIVSNTTISRDVSLTDCQKTQAGGLSGKPLFELSTKMLKDMYTKTGGKIPIIGVGGITSAEDVYKKIRAGASLVQIYSAFIYEGFGLVEKIKRDLAQLLQQDGFKSISEAVGKDCII